MRTTWAAVAVALATLGLPLAGAWGAEPAVVGEQDKSDPSKIHDCLITPIQLIDVPAQEQGVLLKITVRENQQVKKGDLLAQIDDRQAMAAKSVADSKLLAAEKEAGNRISVDYAKAKNLVAQATYDKGEESNRREPNTTPAIELLKLKLEVVASKLETDHAEYQLQIAATNVDVRKAELVAAEIDVERRKVIAPFDAEVVKRLKEEGEWVKPGDGVIQIVRMDRLRIEAYVDGSQLAPVDVTNRPVSVKVKLARDQEAAFEGVITHVSPLVEAGFRRLVWADIVNRQRDGDWILGPGMKAEMTIQLKR